NANTMSAANATPTMITCRGLIDTSSRCMSLPLRTPKKLQNTAPATCRSDADFDSEFDAGGSGSSGASAGTIRSVRCAAPRLDEAIVNPRLVELARAVGRLEPHHVDDAERERGTQSEDPREIPHCLRSFAGT